MREPIVITGIGLATSLGTSAEETWAGVRESRDSLSDMPALESSAPLRADGHSKGGYQAAELPAEFLPNEPREVCYLRWTIQQALSQSGADRLPPDRVGIVLGTTLHGMRSGGHFLRTNDFASLRTFLAGSTMQRALEPFAFTGDALTTCSACSSSLGSVALAVTLLESRQLDCVICGGYDATSEYAYAGFNSLRLVSDDRLRPFAKDRTGMKLGEGYGILVLERAADASQRGASPIARVLGFGESSDAHHLTQPHPHGEGAAAAVRAALTRSGRSVDEIDLICAHATATPDNDAGEHQAYAAVFGERLKSISIAGLKSHIGHTLGGAGAVELILAALALRDQQIPPTAHVTSESMEFEDVKIVSGCAKPATIRAALNTSLGFGGANTCVVLSPSPAAPGEGRGEGRGEGDFERRTDIAILNHPHPDPLPGYRARGREVFISGIGVLVPGAIGNDAFAKLIASEPAPLSADSGPLTEADYLPFLNARRVRRLSEYVKLTLAAASLAMTDAGVAGDATFAANCSAILGSTHAGAGYCIDYYKQIVEGGMAVANPMLFAEGVPNAAAAHLSLTLGLKGACQTILGTRTAGLDALRLAYLRIATGQWDRAVVSAAEEFTPLARQAYSACLADADERCGFFFGSGAVTMVLESAESLKARGGRARGRITAAVGGRYRAGHAVADVARVLREITLDSEIIGSANHTWIDRVESAAMARSSISSAGSTYGRLPELFSVGPLTILAADLLQAGTHRPSTVLCTGFSGTVATARWEKCD